MACFIIRMHIFKIRQESRFNLKRKVCNIIAVATTGALIAGCTVMEAIKIHIGQEDQYKTVYLRSLNHKEMIYMTKALLGISQP